MTSPDWIGGIIAVVTIIAMCGFACWFNPEKENRHK